MERRRKLVIEPTRRPGGRDDMLRFRHLLLRDAAYAGLPKALRAELHERFAGWLEAAAGERLREHPELLAHHLERAYRLLAELGPVDERGRALAGAAAGRLTQAGRRALALGDFPAVAKLLQREPSLQARRDLRRFKQLMETGEVAVNASPSARRSETPTEPRI